MENLERLCGWRILKGVCGWGILKGLCGWGISKGCVIWESWTSFSFPQRTLEK